jgi:hypothetical protein
MTATLSIVRRVEAVEAGNRQPLDRLVLLAPYGPLTAEQRAQAAAARAAGREVCIIELRANGRDGNA